LVVGYGTERNDGMKKPIFILGAHKSGSSLLRHLFDGHPELFSVPIETHIFQYAGFWVDYRLRETKYNPKSLAEIAEAYIANIEQYNSRHKKMSDSNLVNMFDMEKVRSRLQMTCDSFPQLIGRYVQAIYAGLLAEEMPAHLRIVEKSVENAEYAQDLLKIYPDAKFIHIIRNPYAHIVSLRLMRAFDTNRPFPFLGGVVEMLHNHYYHLQRNQRFIDAYKVIRYEDLLSHPEYTMRELADFAGISFSNTLLTPTSLGREWGGNSSRGEEFNGLEATNQAQWQAQISDMEINYINRFFGFMLEAYDYAFLPHKRSLYLPHKYESPVIYIANRLIPYWHKR
jgi:hypothetical protein